MIAGFEQPDAGTIHVDGRSLAEVAPHKRPVNTVFQSYALFPFLNVRGQRRLRPALPADHQAGDPPPRRGGARPRADGDVRQAQAAPAVGRPAAAGRARPGARPRAHGAAARRADGRPRREAPQAAADRAARPPARDRDDVRLRHPRPGGGADDVRPARGHAPGPRDAGRHAERGLLAARELVRRQLPRLHEPVPRHGDRGPRRRAGLPRRPPRPGRGDVRARPGGRRRRARDGAARAGRGVPRGGRGADGARRTTAATVLSGTGGVAGLPRRPHRA